MNHAWISIITVTRQEWAPAAMVYNAMQAGPRINAPTLAVHAKELDTRNPRHCGPTSPPTQPLSQTHIAKMIRRIAGIGKLWDGVLMTYTLGLNARKLAVYAKC